MSLVTRCPQCRTLFRITPTQLQAASGQVRCGRCTTVFDGYAALTPEPAAESRMAHEIPAQANELADKPADNPPIVATPAGSELAATPTAAPRRISPTARYAISIVVLLALLSIQVAYA